MDPVTKHLFLFSNEAEIGYTIDDFVSFKKAKDKKVLALSEAGDMLLFYLDTEPRLFHL